MTLLQVCEKVTAEHQCHVVRPRKIDPLADGVPQYDAKPYGGGSKRGWFYVDAFTASAIHAVGEKINPENQAKLNRLPFLKAATICFRLVK